MVVIKNMPNIDSIINERIETKVDGTIKRNCDMCHDVMANLAKDMLKMIARMDKFETRMDSVDAKLDRVLAHLGA